LEGADAVVEAEQSRAALETCAANPVVAHLQTQQVVAYGTPTEAALARECLTTFMRASATMKYACASSVHASRSTDGSTATGNGTE